MLTTFRDKVYRTIESLEQLIQCLDTLGFHDTRNYVIMCAQSWWVC